MSDISLDYQYITKQTGDDNTSTEGLHVLTNYLRNFIKRNVLVHV